MDEEKQFEEVLKKAKQKMPRFDLIIDLFDMTVYYITKRGANVSGRVPEEMMGEHISNFMSTPSQTDEFREVMRKSMSNDPMLVPVKTKDDQNIKIEMRSIVIEVNSNSYLVTRII